MMRYGGLGIVVLSGLLVGCQGNAKPAPPPQPPAMGYEEIRSDLMAANPGAVVGQVGGTQLDAHLVLIENVDPGQLPLGSAVSFLDDRMQVLTNGTVTKIMPDGNIIVRIENQPTGSRNPEVGDVAVHIPLGATLNTTPPPAATMPGPTTMPATQPDMNNPAPPAGPENPTPPGTQPAGGMNPTPAPAVPATPPATEPAPPPAPAPAVTQPELNK